MDTSVCKWTCNSESSAPIVSKFWHSVPEGSERVKIYIYIWHLYLARKRWSLKQSPKLIHRLFSNFATTLPSRTRLYLHTYIHAHPRGAETGRGGTGRDEIARDGTGWYRTGREGIRRDEMGRNGTGRNGAGRDGTVPRQRMAGNSQIII
jgi:hypothetical protein